MNEKTKLLILELIKEINPQIKVDDVTSCAFQLNSGIDVKWGELAINICYTTKN